LYQSVSECRVAGSHCALGHAFSIFDGSCIKCPPGRFSDSSNASFCTDCNLGKYAHEPGKSACLDCPSHFFSNVTGMSFCLECTGGNSAFAGSSSCYQTTKCQSFKRYNGSTRAFLAIRNTLPFIPDVFHARSACQEYVHTADLAKIDSANLSLWISSDPLIQLYITSKFWVGLDLAVNGTYRWMIDSSIAVNTSIPWCPGYPMNTDGQHISAMFLYSSLSSSYCLVDVLPGTSSSLVICELDIRNCLDSCGSGYYSGKYQGYAACIPCEEGTFSGGRGSVQCNTCPPGMYASSKGATACTPCKSGSYSFGGRSECQNCPLNSITPYAVTGISSSHFCYCPSGYFGRAYLNESCLKCEHSFQSCGDNFSIPFIKSGYWLEANSGVVLNCLPATACISTGFESGTICESGYTGRKCGSCIYRQSYRSGTECKICGQTRAVWALFVMLGFAFVTFIFKSVRSTRKSSGLPDDIKIMIFSLQMISVFPSLFNSWPLFISKFFNVLSVLNIDLELFSLECSLAIDFWSKWLFKVNFPFILICSSGIVIIVGNLISKWRNSDQYSTSDQLALCFTRIFVEVLTYTYVYMIFEVFKPFNCVKDLDGSFSLQASPDLKCFDSQWNQHIAYLVIYIFIYVFLLPGALITFFVRYKRDIQNVWFVERFGSLCAPFKSEVFFWEALLILKRTVFSFSTNVLNALLLSILRYFAVLFFLFVFFGLDVLCLPYSSRFSNQLNLL
jgi:hypothetical protein